MSGMVTDSSITFCAGLGQRRILMLQDLNDNGGGNNYWLSPVTILYLHAVKLVSYWMFVNFTLVSHFLFPTDQQSAQ